VEVGTLGNEKDKEEEYLVGVALLNQVVFNVLKNPNPLKDDEASALLDAAVLV